MVERPKLSIHFPTKDDGNSPRPTDLFEAKSPHDENTVSNAATTSDKKEDEEGAWLQVGLLVRVREKELASGLYYRMTGIVKKVVEKYGGEIYVENNDILKLDQDDCETVVPSQGEFGLIVKGQYRDTKAKVIMVERGDREVEVELEEGTRRGHRTLIPSTHISRHISIK